jgi:hypothetical protein
LVHSLRNKIKNNSIPRFGIIPLYVNQTNKKVVWSVIYGID